MLSLWGANVEVDARRFFDAADLALVAGDPESYGYTADMYTGDGLRIATKGGQPNRGLGFGTGMSPSSRAAGGGSVSWIWTRRTRNATEDMRAHGEPIPGPRAVARYVAS